MPVDFESYHLTELAEELDISRGSIGTTLRRLEQRGLVRHKGEYWALNVKAYDAHTASEIGLYAVAEQFEGDYYDQNPNWDADLPDINAEQTDGE